MQCNDIFSISFLFTMYCKHIIPTTFVQIGKNLNLSKLTLLDRNVIFVHHPPTITEGLSRYFYDLFSVKTMNIVPCIFCMKKISVPVLFTDENLFFVLSIVRICIVFGSQ